jgi:hypothetical protein
VANEVASLALALIVAGALLSPLVRGVLRPGSLPD